jgi:hypothetical protein
MGITGNRRGRPMEIAMDSAERAPGLASRRAMEFVILIGIVCLFADMTYEGARSVTWGVSLRSWRGWPSGTPAWPRRARSCGP